MIKKELYPASASREELDIELNILEGALPTDFYGFVYLNSSVGTPNSDGLPFPTQRPDGTTNPEYGSPLLGGDSMVYQYNLNENGKLKLKSRLLKPPCYYADKATKYWQDNQKNSHYEQYGFRNMGLTRISYLLGMRNELCTAITPFQFNTDKAPRLLANFDAGRPYEFDAQTLDIKTPIGANIEWLDSSPSLWRFPLPIIHTTAHPVFDPITQELFSVNLVRRSKFIIKQSRIAQVLLYFPRYVEKMLERKIKKLKRKFPQNEDNIIQKKYFVEQIDTFFEKIGNQVQRHPTWWRKSRILIKKKVKSRKLRKPKKQEAVYLMRWKGKGQWEKWKLIDQKTKKNIFIQQSMHQIGITKDYVVLVDTGFKVSLDMMFNNPFPHNSFIDDFFRQITTTTMLNYTTVYLVNRREIDTKNKTLQVCRLESPLPYETIHFSVDYENPNDTITFHAAHNSAACLAEWVRAYDKNELTGEKSNPKFLGLPPTGLTDISHIGCYKIQGKTGKILEQKIITEMGNIKDLKNIGANTWGIALYTHRDIVLPNRVASKVKHIFWQCYGLEKHLLTEFIYGLYKNYDKRQVSLEDIRKYTAEGIPFVLSRTNMETMEFEDAFVFEKNDTFRAIQFVPRKRETPDPNIDESLDGYIFCAVTVGQLDPQEPANLDKTTYQSQIWIFDAADLSKPLCKLAHEKLIANTTLHSAWLETAESIQTNYNIDVRSDYDPLIKSALLGDFSHGILFRRQRKEIQSIFDKYIYPNFY